MQTPEEIASSRTKREELFEIDNRRFLLERKKFEEKQRKPVSTKVRVSISSMDERGRGPMRKGISRYHSSNLTDYQMY